MAYILWSKGEQSLINTWLGGFTTSASAAPWVPDSTVYVGMGCKTGGVGADKTVVNGTNPASTLAELGTHASAAASNGYARQPIARDAGGTGWPQATISSGSYQSTAPQVTFSFTGSPNQNDATLWFVGLAITKGGDDCIFGADLAATRTFSNGDTERITITYRQT